MYKHHFLHKNQVILQVNTLGLKNKQKLNERNEDIQKAISNFEYERNVKGQMKSEQ